MTKPVLSAIVVLGLHQNVGSSEVTAKGGRDSLGVLLSGTV